MVRKAVHPEFFLDSGLWEFEGFREPSLYALQRALPKGTKIIGYYPKGAPRPTFEEPKEEGSSPGRPLIQHISTKKHNLRKLTGFRYK